MEKLLSLLFKAEVHYIVDVYSIRFFPFFSPAFYSACCACFFFFYKCALFFSSVSRFFFCVYVVLFFFLLFHVRSLFSPVPECRLLFFFSTLSTCCSFSACRFENVKKETARFLPYILFLRTARRAV